MRASSLLVVCAACGGGHVTATSTTQQSASASTTPSATPSASTACSDAPPPDPFQPHPAWSGRAASIADPPALPSTALRVGDAFTVYGALRALEAIDADKLLAHDIVVVGWIVDTNLPRAPKCVIHHTGVADPPNCNSQIPTFTIADEKDAPASAPRIRVMGWASNFANVYEAYLKDRAHDTTPRTDELWAKEIPQPLPAVGAKVKLTGRYGAMFALASSGIEVDPRRGIVTLTRAEYLEPARTPASFPQLGAGK